MAAVRTKLPPCGVGVGGGQYPGYIPLSLSDFRRPTVHNPLLQLHQRCQGFPLIGGPVKCTVGLFLAEGMLLLGGQLVSEVGFVNGTYQYLYFGRLTVGITFARCVFLSS
jgi:hypothetical protein